jgi:hypothetical protein
LTPEFCRQFLDLPMAPGVSAPHTANRPTFQKSYASLMKSGDFEWGNQILLQVVYNNVVYRIGGDYLCQGRLLLGDDPAWSKTIRSLRFTVSSEEEFRAIISHVSIYLIPSSETRMRRSLVRLLCSQEWAEIPGAVALSILGGFAFFVWKDAAERRERMRRGFEFTLLQNFPVGPRVAGFIIWAMTTHPNARYLRKRPVTAAMLATFCADDAAASDFWSGVADSRALAKTDPRVLLSKKLLRPFRLDRTSIESSDEKVYRPCAAAWNAWRDNRQLKVLRQLRDEDRPTFH